MIMLVDLSGSTVTFSELNERLEKTGKSISMDIRIMREEIFDAMHRLLKKLQASGTQLFLSYQTIKIS